MSQNVAKFVAAIETHFPVRHKSEVDEKEWFSSMVRNLNGYKSDVLEEAAQKIIDTRSDRRFPLPAECKKICNEIAERHNAEALPLKARKDESPYADWRVKLADELISTGQIGKRAAREGWILSLHDFVRENQRLPDEREIANLKIAARDFDDAYEDVVRADRFGDQLPVAGMLMRLGESMMERRRKLAEIVEGGRS